MSTTSRTITAAYVQAPYKLEFREVELPPPGPGQILVEVTACGICGYDLEIAAELATEPRAFGHEIAGIVAEVGAGVTNVAVGDPVALESSSFCGVCEQCRNGRVDICTHSFGFWGGPSQALPRRCCPRRRARCRRLVSIRRLRCWPSRPGWPWTWSRPRKSA